MRFGTARGGEFAPERGQRLAQSSPCGYTVEIRAAVAWKLLEALP